VQYTCYFVIWQKPIGGKKVNINDYAQVRLTADGVIQHAASFTAIGMTERKAGEALKHAAVGDGSHRFPIWELMNIFGDQMRITNTKQMFVNNVIKFVPI
jgi:hypothetical protein